MDHPPVLIIITGMPATGKTVLSKKLAARLRLPLLAKDDIKARIFDGLGWSGRDWSVKVGITSFRIMDYVIEEQLRAGNALIVKCPFDPAFDNKRFQGWQEQYGFRCVQIVCEAERAVLLQRFKTRAEHDTGRHPGHAEAVHMEQFMAELAERSVEPLDLRGEVIRIDTTDFALVDEVAITAQVAAAAGLIKQR